MADGTESQASDGSSADSPQSSHAHYLDADTGRVARIVAALRKAHAEQVAATAATAAATAPVPPPPPTADPGSESRGSARADEPAMAAPAAGAVTDAVTDTAELPDAPAPRRETTGVRPTKPVVPSLRWNPGARYRASRLASYPSPQQPGTLVPAAHQPPIPAPTAGPPVHAPVPQPPAAAQGAVPPPPPGPGPVPAPPGLAGRLYRGPAKRTAVFEREIWHPVARSARVPRDVSEALVAAVERYRKGSISTSGLVRAIGSAHAA
ncbi:hypothetical protein [Promicromonospora iranensis]|uniref:hypothetical protein n=1 Tax=Promicromonospora iranensis TaxID=1105144 RepID=UPI0023A9C62A|nr:hypothetical protein [Promicromonospora iranensis]